MPASKSPSPTTPSNDLTPQGGLAEGALHDLLGYQFAQATILTTTVYERTVGGPLDLRPVEFTILQLIHENAPVTATTVAKALAVTTPGVTLWLDRLEGRGLISRERSEVDRRTQDLRVTRKGQDLVRPALAQLLAAERVLLQVLSDGERRMLLELLQKIARTRSR